ncbi:hypothetical protein ASL20_30390 [Cupriavidus necator]|uniref:alpha/beta fold hydrolase n=1 Tax=Cupriavidus necator TaxID=106590 RepID=UPI0007355D88|nr:alpha/beta hydrolase [Cupriavidus necator]KUE85136.1 hypothetical protein ASL20_30390 [Cupriavidus necator]
MNRLAVPRPLVLLHGLNNTPDVWGDVVANLPADVVSIAPVLPASTEIDAIAEKLLEALPERFWLAGFSFGGYVALAMLERAPERMLGLAMVCTTPQADTAAQGLGRRAAIVGAADGDYVKRTLEQGAAAFHPDHRGDPMLQQARRAMVEAYGARSFIAHSLASMMRADRSALLADVRSLLWIAGSDDPLYPPAAVAAMRERAGHGEFSVIGRAGHLVPMEQPVQLARTLDAWMQT